MSGADEVVPVQGQSLGRIEQLQMLMYADFLHGQHLMHTMVHDPMHRHRREGVRPVQAMENALFGPRSGRWQSGRPQWAP